MIKQYQSRNEKYNIDLNNKKSQQKTMGAPAGGNLPPLAPKFKANSVSPTGPNMDTLQEANKVLPPKNVRIFNDNVILVNPNIDCSDKEMYQRNGFKSAGKNLTSFLKNGDTAVYMNDVVIPSEFGLLTKDN